MPEYLRPGVFIQETSFRGKPIQGVSTSTAGFVGAARSGPEGKPTFIGSYGQFRRLFGDPVAVPSGLGDYLGHSVKAFFENGGSRCYVVRALGPGAAAAQQSMDQGTVFRLARGATVRGPSDTLRLNTLRQIVPGTILRILTRPNATSPFAERLVSPVASTNPQENSVVLANPVAAGVTFEADNTMVQIMGAAPSADTGPVILARYRGNDGNRLAVEFRPRDRAPVALTTASGRRVDPAIPLAADAAAGDTTLSFTGQALQNLRVGDRILVGADAATITAIADGDLTFSVSGGGAGADHSAGGSTLTLIARSGNPAGTEVDLGAAPAAFDIDMTGGAGPYGPGTIPHDLAMTLQAGDELRVTTGGNVTEITVSAIRTAQDIAAGAHATIDTALTANAPAATPTRLVATAPGAGLFHRIYVNDATGLTAPNQAGSLQAIAVRNAGGFANAQVVLVDATRGALYLTETAGDFPASGVDSENWVSFEGLQVAANGDDTLTVASTASFYTGAKVELDTGTEKIEATVAAIDSGARTVTLDPPLTLAAPLQLDPDPAQRAAYLRVHEIDVLIWQNDAESGLPVLAEAFEGLTWNDDMATDAGLRYFAERLNDPEIGSKLIEVDTPVAGAGIGFTDAPATANGLPKYLANGDNGGAITDLSLIGEDMGPGRRTGIEALAERDDISMVAVPGVTAETVQAALISHCERLKYRVAVLDVPPDAADVTSIQAHRNNYDSKYAAYYAPWLRALNSVNGRIASFPPSGYAMGIYARTDNSVGVHKAPANEVVRNIVDVALPLTAPEQEVLNPIGVNLIRDLTPRGIRMWGARTISSDMEWKYLNIRRLFIYVEHSIDIGTQWVVFEPNSEALWERVTQSISSFLTGVWKSGALMGTTPEEGFFVTCDRSTMSQDDIDNGRLVCEIGLAPVAPAEFVIFKIGQFTASSS
ncbi:phage tail sheath family protein [Paracoccus caeni]|uniref:Phage tail sheath family protein n=1 Tax=Paracoccus caeni TaxID=657651 RepID=A0A934SJZ6_9RHOB|nr:phage tail sheath subtilisin-like domain-containing protein [Paracoccus caeni]MBK4216499.1 phage tail sheath family protein [Paracoccus caeni]